MVPDTARSIALSLACKAIDLFAVHFSLRLPLSYLTKSSLESRRREDRRRRAEPDPRSAERRSLLRGAEAKPGQGLSRGLEAGPHSRVPPGPGSAARDRHAGRPRGRADR